MTTFKWRPSIYPEGVPSPNVVRPCSNPSVWFKHWDNTTCSFTVNGPANVSSTIDVNGQIWSLLGKPLDVWSQSRLSIYGGPHDTWYLSYENLTFSSEYLQQNSVCQPTDRYQWGFSSLLLLVFCLFSTLFTITLTLLHYDAFWNSRTARYHYDVNHYRDAVDLVYELEKKHFGPSLRAMPARELKRHVEAKDNSTGLDTLDLHQRSTRLEEVARLLRNVGGGATASVEQICTALNIRYPFRTSPARKPGEMVMHLN